MNWFKEILDASSEKLRTPLFGTTTLISLVLNWSDLYILFFSLESAFEKVERFKNETSIWTLLVFPLGLAAIIILIAPWVSFFLAKFTDLPVEKKKMLEIESSHRRLQKRQKYEQDRLDLIEARREEVIKRAKKNEEDIKSLDPEIQDDVRTDLQKIGQLSLGSDVREELTKVIEDLKAQVKYYETRIEAADSYDTGKISELKASRDHVDAKLEQAILDLADYEESLSSR